MSAAGMLLVLAGLGVWAGGTIRYRLQLTLADVIALVLITAGDALRGSWLLTAIAGAFLAYVTWSWWHRRKRRRAPRALGAKAKARIAAMVTRMRERPARPVLRPVAGGAR